MLRGWLLLQLLRLAVWSHEGDLLVLVRFDEKGAFLIMDKPVRWMFSKVAAKVKTLDLQPSAGYSFARASALISMVAVVRYPQGSLPKDGVEM